MYQGYVTNSEQDRARWELMQKRAAAKAKPQPVKIDHLLWALAMKRQQEGVR
jgi:hypothetical protein